MMKKITKANFKNFVTDQYVQMLELTQNWLNSKDGSCNEDVFIALKKELDDCNALELAKSVLKIEQASDDFNMEVKKIISE